MEHGHEVAIHASQALRWIPLLPLFGAVTNFLLVDLGERAAARTMASGLLARGLVPRTFAADHPLAAHLRFTVRDQVQDDLLIAAFAELASTVRAATPAPDAAEEASA
mgnify:CR=1 FL=1